MTPAARIARGLSALAGLVGAVVGVPFALLALGQGPPGGIPSAHTLIYGLTHNVTDASLLRAAGLACWLVWALFALAVATEIVRQLAGVAAVPGRRGRFGVPGLQGWARTLVLTAALLLPQRVPVGAMASPAGGSSTAIVKVVSSAVVSGAPAARAAVPPKPTPAGVRYVVQRYDSPWAIAERHLGSGFRWREIQDASGRPLLAAGGGARIIHPGEILLLPIREQPPAHHDPVVAPPPARQSSAARAPATPQTNAPAGRTPAALHAPAPTAPAPTAPPPTAPAHTAPPPTAPPRTAPPPTAPPPTAPLATATTPATIASPVGAPIQDPPPPTMVAVATTHGGTNGRADVAALAEAGLLGAAVLSVVRVLRRRQSRHRPPGRRIRLPGPEVAATELVLAEHETPDRVALVERAMPLLAPAWRAASPSPTILGLLVDDMSIEVLLDRPVPAPSPWVTTAEGFRWRAGADLLPESPEPGSTLLPALASLGRVAAGTADALVNLEAAGLVSVTGDPSRGAGFLYALATQLVGAPWAAAVNVVLVAFPPGLATRDNVRQVASLDEVIDQLQANAEVMAATARRHGCADLFAGRAQGLAGDGWPPSIVLCALRLSAQELQLLATLTRPGTGVAAVVVNAGAVAGWEVDVDTIPCPVSPLRLAVQPTVVDASTAAAIAELLAIAEDDSGAGLADPPYDRIDVSVDRPHFPALREQTLTARLGRIATIDGQPAGDAAPAILVRVLGSVEIDGAAEFKRAKSRELVVYLAMHPNGVGESELDEALWASTAGRVVLSSTRDSTVSVARTSLGGAARLLPAQGQGREKRYQLGPEVQSDWSQFCVLHRFGREHRSTAALRQALDLVRGRPFEAVISGRTYGWIHTEGHGRHIEAEVADAADLAAGLFLEAGDPLGARWAARRGLLAEPYTERLWVRLMEAADVLGESQEIERVMDEMDVVLELAGDFTSLHPNTLAVYDRLSRRHRFPAS